MPPLAAGAAQRPAAGGLAALALALLLLPSCATSPTGRRQLLVVPESFAIQASQQAYTSKLQSFAQEGKLDGDPSLVSRVERITSRIVAQAVEMRPDTREWAWSMRVLESEEVNAWAMPGGKMAIYTGFVQTIQPSDDELAQVIGHEIGHALAKHGSEKMSMAMVTQGGVAALGIALGSAEAMAAAAAAATLALQLPNSREAEAEADVIGMELAARAGYDPRAAATLWKKMGEAAAGKTPPEFLSTHPSPARRQEDLAALAPEMQPLYQEAPREPPTWPINRGDDGGPS